MKSTQAHRRLLVAGISALLAIPLSAQEILRLEDQGERRNFILAEDEVVLRGDTSNAERLRDDLEAALPGAKVQEIKGRDALLKLPQRIDRRKAAARQEVMHTAAPALASEPVLYQEGVLRSIHSRRLVGTRVLAKLKDGQTPEQLAAASGAVSGVASPLAGHALLTFRDGWESLAASETLAGQGTSARPLLRRYAERMWVPNDPYVADQWHVKNRGQGGGTVGIDANLPNAWDLSKGAGVTVVVVDDSLQTTHPDLDENTPAASSGRHYDFRDNNQDPAPSAYDDAHGTSVAGVIAARGNNSLGVTGAAPEAELLGIRLIGGYFDAQTAYDALTWEPNGITSSVSNNSWGYGGVGMISLDPLERQALRDAATTGRGGLGQVTLFAAANNDEMFNGYVGGIPTFTSQDANYQPYANSRFVIGVAACTNYGDHSYYSNRGASVLICAPSNGGSLGIFTTDNTGSSGYNSVLDPGGQPGDNNYTNSFGGTSSATPLTSGVVALMLSANPNLGYRDVQEILVTSARQIDSTNPDWKTNAAGYHFAHAYGGGMVDAAAAVARSLQWTNLAPVQSFTRTASSLPAAIPDNNTTGVTQSFDFSAAANLRVEHVEVVIRATHSSRSELEISLTSPNGTRSILNPTRAKPSTLYYSDNDQNIGSTTEGWVYMTTHNWGENSVGTWTLTTRDLRGGNTGTLAAAEVRVYGTPSVQQRVRFTQRRISTTEDAGTINLQVQRSGSSLGTASVEYAVVGGTATNGDDYILANGIVNFAAGETTKNIAVQIVDDVTPEAAESFFVVLANPVNATLGGGSICSVSIGANDGNFVTVTASDPDAAETLPSTPGKPVTANLGAFTFTRLVADDQPMSIPFTIEGTAIRGTDYNMPNTVTIPPGFDSATIYVTPIDDPTSEGEEIVKVTLTPSPDYALGDPSSATVKIADNEIPQINILAPATPQVLENSAAPLAFTVRRGAKELAPLTVNLFISGSAEPGLDYVEVPSNVIIPANEDRVDITIQPKDNAIFNPTRTVTLAIAPKTGYLPGFQNTATVRILNDEAPPDPKKPSITISAPKAKARFDAPVSTLVATGTAKDNIAVSRVLYRVNGGEWNIAAVNGGTWSAEIADKVVPGNNRLEAKAEDGDENTSPILSVAFAVVKPRSLTVTVDGAGTVSPKGSPLSLEAGQVYKLSAKPQSGKIFAGWTGDLSGTGKVMSFTMPDADVAVTATFMDNPFVPGIIGRYSGLLRGTSSAPETAGLLEVTVTGTGLVTGKVWVSGKAYPVKGEFNGMGKLSAEVKVPKQPNMQVLLSLDMNPSGSQSITGTVTSTAGVSNVTAFRCPFDGKTNVLGAQFARSYTFYLPPQVPTTIPGQPETALLPHGNGVGLLTIGTNGVVKWTGTLGDGSPVTQTTTLDGQMRWPLYASLYKARGYVSGQVLHDPSASGTDLSATLDWVKLAIPTDKFFPDGFTLEGNALLGVEYTPPAKGVRVLTGYDTAPGNAGPLSLQDGNLSGAGIAGVLTLSSTNVAQVTSSLDKLKISIAPKTGAFSGSFAFPVTKKATQIKGVILQGKIGKGIGTFSGSTVNNNTLQTGRVEFEPLED